MLNRFLVIYGPTAIGKTDFAEYCANNLNGEIINGDLGQCYTPLRIGTAKPDWKKTSFAQHLFDWIDQPRDITVCEYRKHVQSLITDICARGKLPIVVGGSGFYLRSLFFPPVSRASELRHTPLLNNCWDTLNQIDPERAGAIHPNDAYRIDRALQVWYSTGIKPSLCKPHYQPVAEYLYVELTMNREELYHRINERTYQMLQQGWVDEVRSVQGTEWENFLKKKKLIGYDVILEFLEGKIKSDSMTETIAKKTRNYAKRQITYGAMLYRQLQAELNSMTHPKSGCMQLAIDSNIKESYQPLLNQIIATNATLK